MFMVSVNKPEAQNTLMDIHRHRVEEYPTFDEANSPHCEEMNRSLRSGTPGEVGGASE